MADPAGSKHSGGSPRESRPTQGAEPATVSVARYSGLGLQLAASTLLFLAAGRWLDKRIGTDPYLTIVGAFVGASAGFYSLYRGLMKGPRKDEEAEP
jgi:F0F1-type ATP synthase assembly protein I